MEGMLGLSIGISDLIVLSPRGGSPPPALTYNFTTEGGQTLDTEGGLDFEQEGGS